MIRWGGDRLIGEEGSLRQLAGVRGGGKKKSLGGGEKKERILFRRHDNFEERGKNVLSRGGGKERVRI